MQNNANEVATDTTKIEQSPSNFKVILNEFRKDKVAVVSLFLAVTIILAAFIGSMLFNVGGATEVNILDRYMAPGQAAIFSVPMKADAICSNIFSSLPVTRLPSGFRLL